MAAALFHYKSVYIRSWP